MKNINKIITIIATLLITSSIITTQPALANTNTNSEKQQLDKQKAVDKSMNIVLEKANQQMQQGKEDIHVSEYVPEINDNVSINFEVENIPDNSQTIKNNNTVSEKAAKPSGRKNYSGSVNAGAFTHQLRGTFVYGSGKVKSATRQVTASGVTYSHTRPSTITKLDPSVWSISSTSKHKWLGSVGGVAGLGYTSYITVEVYGSGTSKLVQATYKTGA